MTAVIDGSPPVRGRDRQSLMIGNRNQRITRPAPEDFLEIGNVQPSVQRRQRVRRDVLEKWKMQDVGVKVNDVELVPALAHVLKHREVRGRLRLDRIGIEAQRRIAPRDEPGVRRRVRAREQRDVVPELDQRVREIRDDALRAAVALRGHRFRERRDLCNPQRTLADLLILSRRRCHAAKDAPATRRVR